MIIKFSVPWNSYNAIAYKMIHSIQMWLNIKNTVAVTNDTRFFEGMTTYSKTWLQLFFPFIIIY